MQLSRSLIAKAGVVAVALAAAGTASIAQARDNVFFSIGANIAPGVAVTASNAPYYYGGPAYVAAPAPVYYPPAPVYYQPAPVYYAPAPVVRYYWSPEHRRHYYYEHGHRRWR